MGRACGLATGARLWHSRDMRDAETCRHRAAEYEAAAREVGQEANRRRYLHLAECWRELAEAAEFESRREVAA